jgi:hypothetical protein
MKLIIIDFIIICNIIDFQYLFTESSNLCWQTVCGCSWWGAFFGSKHCVTQFGSLLCKAFQCWFTIWSFLFGDPFLAMAQGACTKQLKLNASSENRKCGKSLALSSEEEAVLLVGLE